VGGYVVFILIDLNTQISIIFLVCIEYHLHSTAEI